MSRYRRLKAAFSLLELIIAIAILSTGIITVIQALAFCARTTGLSSDIINAVFLAEDKLEELDLQEREGRLNPEASPVKMIQGKFEYEYSLEPEPELDLYKLNFTLSWQRQNRKEFFSINTYLRQ